jgi:hypothetical protein
VQRQQNAPLNSKSQKREDLRRKLREKPSDDSVSDRSAINIAPLEFSEDVLCVHSAGLDERLVTAAIVPGRA